MPGRAELVAHCAESTGRDVSAFRWYQVLACFRLVAPSWRAAAPARSPGTNREPGDGLHACAEWLCAAARRGTERG
ncbi:hypothetical protein KMT30_11670 [Streptomyces sp. IBSBF 2953]|uniref:hypothetical protein n=1 Tax=Streptomyces TaxID=1883 RepID=UPI002119E577|nr:hypothetical protein [Streptomyces scabiei]MCQ9179678.1 hypothetical protein [Streptomyces hayashii]MDX3116246.1 hypothetical protein [Streptomyces scabiei]